VSVFGSPTVYWSLGNGRRHRACPSVSQRPESDTSMSGSHETATRRVIASSAGVVPSAVMYVTPGRKIARGSDAV